MAEVSLSRPSARATSLSRRQNTYRTYHQATPRHAAVALMMAISRAMVEDEQYKGLEGFLTNPMFG
jgi:hypothetical protein